MKRDRVIVYISAAGLAGLLIMLNFISPTEAGPLGVLLFFTTLFGVTLGITIALMKMFYKMSGRRQKMLNKDYLYAVLIAFLPIMLLMACSFGVFNVWTVGLILIFLFLIGFLVNKKF